MSEIMILSFSDLIFAVNVGDNVESDNKVFNSIQLNAFKNSV